MMIMKIVLDALNEVIKFLDTCSSTGATRAPDDPVATRNETEGKGVTSLGIPRNMEITKTYSRRSEKITGEKGKPKTSWSDAQTRFLISMMTEYKLSGRYHGESGWTEEAWNNMTKHLNDKYPTANYTVSELKDREQQLEKEHNIMKQIISQNGFGWNPKIKMATAIDEKWKELSEDHQKWRNRQFPYYEDLYDIYDGKVVKEKHCKGAFYYHPEIGNTYLSSQEDNPHETEQEFDIKSPDATRLTAYFDSNCEDGMNLNGTDATYPTPTDIPESCHAHDSILEAQTQENLAPRGEEQPAKSNEKFPATRLCADFGFSCEDGMDLGTDAAPTDIPESSHARDSILEDQTEDNSGPRGKEQPAKSNEKYPATRLCTYFGFSCEDGTDLGTDATYPTPTDILESSHAQDSILEDQTQENSAAGGKEQPAKSNEKCPGARLCAGFGFSCEDGMDLGTDAAYPTPTDIPECSHAHDLILEDIALESLIGLKNSARGKEQPATSNEKCPEKTRPRKTMDLALESLIALKKEELECYKELKEKQIESYKELKEKQIESYKQIKLAQMERNDPNNDPYTMARCIARLKEIRLLEAQEMMKTINHLKKDRLNREIFMSIDTYPLLVEFIKEALSDA